MRNGMTSLMKNNIVYFLTLSHDVTIKQIYYNALCA